MYARMRSKLQMYTLHAQNTNTHVCVCDVKVYVKFDYVVVSPFVSGGCQAYLHMIYTNVLCCIYMCVL